MIDSKLTDPTPRPRKFGCMLRSADLFLPPVRLPGL